MEILNTFIEQASNIWWGIVASVVMVAVLYLIIYIFNSGRKEFTPLSYLVAVPLLPILSFQFFLLFGSISLKHSSTEIAHWIDALVPKESVEGQFSRGDINEVISQVASVFPLANKLIDTDILNEENDHTLGEALTHKVCTYLNWYIVRRVAWSIGFIIVGFIAILFTTHSNNFDLDDIDGLNDLSYENMDDLGII